MDDIRSQDECSVTIALKILSWLVKAQRTLTVDEMRHAVAIESGKWTLPEGDIPDKTTMLNICKGLVTIDHGDDTFRLTHFTVHSYLLQNCPLPNADRLIAEACLTYLSFPEFSRATYNERFRGQQWQDTHPFFTYAAK